MYCQKCGAQTDDQAAFCDKCGMVLQRARLDTSTPAPAGSATVEYAGFWKRLLAAAVDYFICSTAELMLVGILFVANVIRPHSETFNAVYTVTFIVVAIVMTALYLLYWPLMESSRHQGTLGKTALGIVVTDINGNRISFARALGRNLGRIVSAIIYYVGFIMIAFTSKKQGLHDIMADCLVVVKR